MNIGRSCPRYQELGLLYKRSTRLQTRLCEYFTTVVRLCTKSVLFLKKSSIGQFSASIASPFESQIGAFEHHLERLAGDIRDEIAFLSSQLQSEEASSNSNFRGIMTKFSDRASQQLAENIGWRRRKAKLHFLDACSTYNYQQAWKVARKKGKTRWVCESSEYKEWKSEKKYSALWCSGILGSGKTVVAANVIEELALDPTIDIIGYFFCRYDETESLQARTMLGCLVRQVYEGLALENTDNLAFKDQTMLDIDHLTQCLGELPSSKSRICLVIDGLDECEENEARIVLECLKQLISSSHTFLVFCSSRPDIFQWAPSLIHARWHVSISQARSDVDAEIARYIESELGYRIDAGSFCPSDYSIIPIIIKTLLEGAKGM